MSDEFIVTIEDGSTHILSIDTSFIDNLGLVEIERYESPTVNILTSFQTITINDLPDIPSSKISGNFDVSRIDNLDDYLDHYQFDCGTP
jgi:hypothetical protein